MHIAALVTQFLRATGKFKLDDSTFASLAPNITNELALPVIGDAALEEGGNFSSRETWSVAGVTTLLKSAAKLLEQAKAYELCIEVLMLLTTIYKAEKSYAELLTALDQFKSMTTTLLEAVRKLFRNTLLIILLLEQRCSHLSFVL